MRERVDLNKVHPVDDVGEPELLAPIVVGGRRPETSVYFEEMATRLVEKIESAHLVVGCMAWFTSVPVLEALAKLPGGCQIVVQKEDFLRPDDVTKAKLHSLYSALRCPDRMELPFGSWQLSYGGSSKCDSVRCMGVVTPRGETGPKMHHKFFVFLNAEGQPYAVWTGSFNATANASRCRENAVYMIDEVIASAYGREWLRMLALSEPLNWEQTHVAPEWRFGS